MFPSIIGTMGRRGDKKKGHAKGILILLGATVMVCLVTLLVILGMRKAVLSREGELADLENRVRRMDRLVTARQTYREVFYREVKGFLTDKRVLFSVLIDVEAGIDLGKCRVESLPGDRVTVFLPPPRILSIDADESSIEQIFKKEQWAPLRYSDFSHIVEGEKERLRGEAADSGLLNRAEVNGANTITAIFRMAGIENVSVRFTELVELGGRDG